jgi:hypothetical protein
VEPGEIGGKKRNVTIKISYGMLKAAVLKMSKSY